MPVFLCVRATVSAIPKMERLHNKVTIATGYYVSTGLSIRGSQRQTNPYGNGNRQFVCS
jgi:hypothetical protein